jgi:medium-chain acyl-[acyl-carrier-protein] hydrolase
MIQARTGNDKWIQNRGSNPAARMRLFCFAYAGGSASVFRGWAGSLPVTVEVCPVQLPGRENRYREKLITDFDELVASLSQALRPALDLPFAFFGHSLGALIAFEVARKIEQNPLVRGRLQQLFVSASRAPQFRTPDDETYKMPREQFIERLREMGGTPAEILQNTELLDFLLPIVRADFQLLASYTYRPGLTLKCPVTIFGGEQDHQISREQLEGWQVQTGGSTELKMFSDNHFFLNSQSQQVLHELTQRLNQSMGKLINPGG